MEMYAARATSRAKVQIASTPKATYCKTSIREAGRPRTVRTTLASKMTVLQPTVYKTSSKKPRQTTNWKYANASSNAVATKVQRDRERRVASEAPYR